VPVQVLVTLPIRMWSPARTGSEPRKARLPMAVDQSPSSAERTCATAPVTSMSRTSCSSSGCSFAP
jgi:hypothetical protein